MNIPNAILKHFITVDFSIQTILLWSIKRYGECINIEIKIINQV